MSTNPRRPRSRLQRCAHWSVGALLFALALLVVNGPAAHLTPSYIFAQACACALGWLCCGWALDALANWRRKHTIILITTITNDNDKKD